MTLNGIANTRSRIGRNHALIAPDSQVQSRLPRWQDTEGIFLISPAMGARFTQYIALMTPASSFAGPGPGIECLLYVLEGRVEVERGKRGGQLESGGYAWFPPDASFTVTAGEDARLLVFEKRYLPLPGVGVPEPFLGQLEEVEGEPFMGDPDARLKTLLPEDPSMDMAVNLFTYQPGAALPFVEVHIMEHGLMMVEGAGIYRLEESWYPVYQGDCIWMGPYCAQWFVAMGKRPASYIYYKNVNRDPMDAQE